MGTICMESDGKDIQNHTDSCSDFPCTLLKLVTVEPILLIAFLVDLTSSIVCKQYVYDYLSDSYGLGNSTNDDLCGFKNETNTTKHLEVEVSAESSSWVLYLNLAGLIPSLFATVLLGPWSDTVGRKFPLFVCTFGGLLKTAIYIIVVQCNLPLYYLLVGNMLSGLCGSLNGILCLCYSYIADASTHTNRTTRVAVAEAASGMGGLVGSLACGVWIDAQGFGPPLWMLLGLTCFSLFYVSVILPESLEIISPLSLCQKIRLLFTWRQLSGIRSMLSESFNKSLKIMGIVLCMFLKLVTYSGVTDVLIIYALSPPLCWASSLVGYATALISSHFLFGMAFIKACEGRLSDIIVVPAATLFSTIMVIIFGFASKTWMVFLGLGIGLPSTVSITVIRSIISRFVAIHEQGSAFALIACSESTADLVATLLFNEVYSDTVAIFPGLIFFIAAGIDITFFVLFLFVYIKIKDDLEKNKEYHSLVIT